MYGYIYLTENLENGRLYVGMTRRKKFSPDYLGSGVLMLKAIKKYGRDRFVVRMLETAEDEETLCRLEIAAIAAMNAVFDDRYYNLAFGGQGAKHLGDRTWSIGRRSAFSRYMKRRVADGIVVMPKGNAGNTEFRHSSATKKAMGNAIREAHARAKKEGRPYHSEDGINVIKAALRASMTEELAAIRNQTPGYVAMQERRREKTDERYRDLPDLLADLSFTEAAEAIGVSAMAVHRQSRTRAPDIERSETYHANLQAKREAAAKLAHEARRKQGDQTWEGFDLAEMYKTMTQAQIAVKVGVSQVRVSQRMKQLGITKTRAASG